MPVSVLLIEGDAQHADAVVRALVSGPLGWQIEVAHSIAQAQALLEQRRPPFDAVLVAQALSDGSAAESSPSGRPWKETTFSRRSRSRAALRAVVKR